MNDKIPQQFPCEGWHRIRGMEIIKQGDVAYSPELKLAFESHQIGRRVCDMTTADYYRKNETTN